MPETVVLAERLSKSFGGARALDDVSFALEEGQCLALYGPNGAGKTTLLRLLAGLLRPTEGRATIAGADIRTDSTVRGRVGLISHQTMLYPALTALENVEFAAALHGIPDRRAASIAALETLGIADRRHSLVRTLSRGMQQRVSIARAIVHAPAILLLDEPYTGLDVNGAAAVSEMLHRLRAGGATMVLVTHNVNEGLAVASHTAVLLAGVMARFASAAGVDPAAFAREYRDLAATRDERSSLATA